MKNYCSQLISTGAVGKSAIVWDYVDGRQGIPRRARVSLGDTDPVTGNEISDPSVFEEYHRIVHREVLRNLAFYHPRTNSRDQDVRDRVAEKQAIREDYLKNYGQEPGKKELDFLYAQRHPERQLLSLDYLLSAEDVNQQDSSRNPWLTDPCAEERLPGMESEPVSRLREYVSTLSPRQQDIYLAMLRKQEGLWITDKELAEKWGVHLTMIQKERRQIIAGIRSAVKNQ